MIALLVFAVWLAAAFALGSAASAIRPKWLKVLILSLPLLLLIAAYWRGVFWLGDLGLGWDITVWAWLLGGGLGPDVRRLVRFARSRRA